MTGPGAVGLLQRLCANRVDKGIGSVTYTSMLNRRGGIECDLTVTRLGSEQFMIVTGTAFGRHDRSWIEEHAPADGAVAIRDVTGALACLGLWGPAARRILTEVCDDDLTFPYMQARAVTVGDVPCWAVRVTYVGELGWELYAGAEFGLALWDTLIEAGGPSGSCPAGYRAIDRCGWRRATACGARTSRRRPIPTRPASASPSRSTEQFLGRDALPPAEGGPHRLVCLVLDDVRSVALGNEPVRTPDGEVVGRVTSGGQGFTTASRSPTPGSPRAAAVGTELTVEVFGEVVSATVVAEPLFRPHRCPHPHVTDPSRP